jgi:DNA-binding MarR family transcriptional regulator
MNPRVERVTDLIFLLKSKCLENELEIMKQSNLSASEFHGIDKLNPGEIVSGKSLSQKMDLSPSRASRIVEKMVKKDFLLRECDPLDRRRCKLVLSEKGIEIKKKIEMMRSDCEKKIREIFSRKEIASFSLGIEKTIKVL